MICMTHHSATWLFSCSRGRQYTVEFGFGEPPDGDGHLFWDRSFPGSHQLAQIPAPAWLASWVIGAHNRVIWHVKILKKALGPYPMCTNCSWIPEWDQDDVQEMADAVPDQPNIVSDGSMEPIPHLDVEVAGVAVFAHFPACVFDSNQWRHAQDLDGKIDGSSHIFAGPLVVYRRCKEPSTGESCLTFRRFPRFISG